MKGYSGNRHWGTGLAGMLSATGAWAEESAATGQLLESPLSTQNLVNTAVGLVAVLALMLLLAWLARRFMNMPAGGGRGQLQIVGGVSLGSREKAVLLVVEGRRLLVGVSPGNVRTLLVLDEGEPGATDFAATLKQAGGRAADTLGASS